VTVKAALLKTGVVALGVGIGIGVAVLGFMAYIAMPKSPKAWETKAITASVE